MGIDSATIANTAALAALDPSWSLVTLLIVGGIIYLLIMLAKNNKITELISNKLSTHDSLVDTVNEIRKDQKLSNLERQEQTIAIESISKRLDKVELEIRDIRCK